MAQLELQKNIWGNGYSGQVEALGLSWSDRQAIENIAGDLAHIGMGVGAVGMVIRDFERVVGLGLEQQLALLHSQTDVLQQIAESLRSPAKTRATEHVLAASELL